ncbi:MAG: integrase [archaeon GB-1867-005]|nr:integrase [Candidatus Culexmicrobium cathedralense]
MEKTLGRRFKLYDLRAFFATYMSIKKVPGQIIDIIQGRVPPKQFKILVRHYLAITTEELRKIYDEANLTTLEKQLKDNEIHQLRRLEIYTNVSVSDGKLKHHSI